MVRGLAGAPTVGCRFPTRASSVMFASALDRRPLVEIIMSTHSRLRALVLVPGLLLGTTADDPGPTGPLVVQGVFEVTLSGAKTGSVTGEALFYLLDVDVGIVRLVLYDYTSDDDHFAVQFVFTQFGTPPEGEHPLSAFCSEGFRWGILMGWEGMWMLSPDAVGTIELTHASDDRLAGSFTIAGQIEWGGEGTVTVHGTFDAPKGEGSSIPEAVR